MQFELSVNTRWDPAVRAHSPASFSSTSALGQKGEHRVGHRCARESKKESQ